MHRKLKSTRSCNTLSCTGSVAQNCLPTKPALHSVTPWGLTWHKSLRPQKNIRSPKYADTSLLYHGNRGAETPIFYPQTDESCNASQVSSSFCTFVILLVCLPLAQMGICTATEGPPRYWESCKKPPVRRLNTSPFFNSGLWNSVLCTTPDNGCDSHWAALPAFPAVPLGFGHCSSLIHQPVDHDTGLETSCLHRQL